MADEALRRHLLGRFAAHGIPPARLTLIAWSRSFAEHLALYANIDVALDSFPYNGTTTTCEALWMGVPVVTLAGDRHASRVGVSLLRGTGLEALGVAENVESYCAKALALVANPAALTALRAGLRDRLRAAPLCDAPRFTRNLEAAYRMMWQRWCTTQCQST
jgi:predicted O-linked N-acetylglucosamine transferase (SPINDLY family)